MDVFTGAPVAKPAPSTTVAPVAAAAAAAGEPGEAVATVVQERTVYVKNLNFATTEEGLRLMFGHIGPVRSVPVAQAKCLWLLSARHGVVSFSSRAPVVLQRGVYSSQAEGCSRWHEVNGVHGLRLCRVRLTGACVDSNQEVSVTLCVGGGESGLRVIRTGFVVVCRLQGASLDEHALQLKLSTKQIECKNIIRSALLA